MMSACLQLSLSTRCLGIHGLRCKTCVRNCLVQVLSLVTELWRAPFLLIALALLLPLTIVIHPTFGPTVRNAAHDGTIRSHCPLASRIGSIAVTSAGHMVAALALWIICAMRTVGSWGSGDCSFGMGAVWLLAPCGPRLALCRKEARVHDWHVRSRQFGGLVDGDFASIPIVPSTPSLAHIYPGLRNAMDRRVPSRHCRIALARRAAGSCDQIRWGGSGHRGIRSSVGSSRAYNIRKQRASPL